ncbi:hypothetical protein [Streptomyces sp. NPDC093598]
MSAASVEQPFHDEEPVTLTTVADGSWSAIRSTASRSSEATSS